MKKVFTIMLLLGLGTLSSSFFISNKTSTHPWETIETQEINGIIAKLKVREYPNITLNNWISIDFENLTKNSLLIENASYSIDCKVYNKKGGKLLKEGKIASRSASEILDKSIDSPFPMIELSPGISTSSQYPSTIGSVFLSVPDQSKVYVDAKLKLYIKFSGKDTFKFNWEEIPFDFEWTRPEAIEFSDLYQQTLELLDKPVYSSIHHYELLSRLSVPEISKGIEAITLIEALKKRTGKEDGRHAIIYHLNDHFKEDQRLLDYYLDLLKNNTALALEDLSIATDIWDQRFLEPLIEYYQQTDISKMKQVINLLYDQQKSWLDQEGISSILSDIILYKYEDIIYAEPATLSKRELLTASLLIEMLGKTGSKEVIMIICPFLNEKERILDTGLVLDTESLELPRPMRVCDNALEALFRLYDMNLIKTYKKEKYKPPYKNGEAEIIITRIRDNLIKDLKRKKDLCK